MSSTEPSWSTSTRVCSNRCIPNPPSLKHVLTRRKEDGSIILTLQLTLNIIRYLTLIQISAYPGRTKEQKEAFAKAITNADVEILKTNPKDVIITYDEKPRENWYISGEQL
ncbi:MAG: tautomerase family protein [Candidatus Nitrosopolaris sp.]